VASYQRLRKLFGALTGYPLVSLDGGGDPTPDAVRLGNSSATILRLPFAILLNVCAPGLLHNDESKSTLSASD
jgi:hypothetical protein